MSRGLQSLSTYHRIYLAVAAIAVPLCIAVGAALFELRDLAQMGRRDVLEAQHVTQNVRELADRLAELERSALEYSQSGSVESDREYQAMRQEFQEALDEVDAESPRLHAVVASLHAEESEIARRFANGASQNALDLFPRIYEGVDALLVSSDRLVSSYADQPRIEASRFEGGLFWTVVLALVASVLLGARLLGTIMQPLRRLADSIQELGSGRFDVPIAIEGAGDIVELGRRLDWLRQRLAALEAQKASFLRGVSHELKTPLTSIREGADLLLHESGGGDANERRVIARILYDNSVRLHGLIEKLIQANRTALAPERSPFAQVALDDVVRNVLREHRLAAAARGLRIETQLQRVVVPGDEDQLATVVDNLLSNAVKFCAAGGEVTLTLAHVGDSAQLDVRDSGPGVAADESARIFDLFYRGSAMSASPVQGSGVGLAIAKSCVERHGGRIEVVAAQHGAHFRVLLPLGADVPAQQLAVA